MERSCLFDNSLKEFLFDQIDNISPRFGLLIGQRLHGKDYVYYGLAVTHNLKFEEYTKKSDFLMKKIESKLIKKCNQTYNMLLGGIDIIGFYISSLKLQNINIISALKAIIFSLFKELEADSYINKSRYGLLLEVNNSKKLYGSYYDLTNKQYSAQNIEISFSDHLSSFISLNSYVSLDCKSLFYSEKHDENKDNISKEIITFISNNFLNEKLLMINEEICSVPDECLESKIKNEKNIDVFLIHDMTKIKSISNNIKKFDSIYSSIGTMTCKAFLHRKCNIEDALKTIIQDAHRSLLARYKLISLSLDTSEEIIECSTNNLYELPKRIFASFDSLPFQFCDYILRDEVEADFMLRFKDLLSFPATIYSDEETFQDIEEEEEVVEQLSSKQLNLNSNSTNLDSNSSFNFSSRLLYVTMVVLVGTISAIYAYYY